MKRIVMALGLSSLLGIALALPLMADDKGMSDKECAKEFGCECVTIDKGFFETVNKVPMALEKAGLILAGDIDWSALKHRAKTTTPPGSMPETPRLDAAAKNVRTILIADSPLVNRVFEKPYHGFFVGKMVIFERDGKTEIAYVKPSVKLEELKKAGIIKPEKVEEHKKECMDYERKLEEAVNSLK